MKIFKAIIATILFIIFIEIIGIWTILGTVIDISVLTTNYYIFINGLLEVIIIVFFLYKLEGTKAIIPQKTSYFYYVIAFALGVSFIFIQTPLDLFYNLTFNTDYQIVYDFKDLNRFLTINSIGLVLFIPIAEELFFRQYIQNRLQINHSYYIAIGISTLLFASIHLSNDLLFNKSEGFDIHKTYIALFGGLFSGITYYKSKSIGPSIVFHIMWNLMTRII